MGRAYVPSSEAGCGVAHRQPRRAAIHDKNGRYKRELRRGGVVASLACSVCGGLFLGAAAHMWLSLSLHALAICTPDAASLIGKASTHLRGETHVVTGGSSGVGYATALALAHAGAHVVIMSHSLSSGERAAKEVREATGSAEVSVIALELSSFEVVRQAAQQLQQRVSRLDAIVCNAAIGAVPADTPPLKRQATSSHESGGRR